MKSIFVVVAVFAAVASGQISALFTYRGGTGCDDDTKIIWAQVSFVLGCTNRSCEYLPDYDTYAMKRCYYNISDAPIPEDVVTVATWAVSDCKGLESVTYQRTGQAGCVANGDFSSLFTCGTISVCNTTQCTACATGSFTDGECTPVGQFFCGRNLAIVPPWTSDAPTSSTPIAAPTMAPTMVPATAPVSAPKSAPAPSSTPAKKSVAAVTVPVSISAASFVAASVLALVC